MAKTCPPPPSELYTEDEDENCSMILAHADDLSPNIIFWDAIGEHCSN